MEDLRERNREEAGTEGGETVFDAEDISRNKFKAVLSYCGLLVLVPLFTAKKSPYGRYHANQGVLLLLARFVITLLYNLIYNIGTFTLGLSLVLAALTGEFQNSFMSDSGLGSKSVISFLYLFVSFVLQIFQCIGLFNAASGRAKELPVIGGIRLLK